MHTNISLKSYFIDADSPSTEVGEIVGKVHIHTYKLTLPIGMWLCLGVSEFQHRPSWPMGLLNTRMPCRLYGHLKRESCFYE